MPTNVLLGARCAQAHTQMPACSACSLYGKRYFASATVPACGRACPNAHVRMSTHTPYARTPKRAHKERPRGAARENAATTAHATISNAEYAQNVEPHPVWRLLIAAAVLCGVCLRERPARSSLFPLVCVCVFVSADVVHMSATKIKLSDGAGCNVAGWICACNMVSSDRCLANKSSS